MFIWNLAQSNELSICFIHKIKILKNTDKSESESHFRNFLVNYSKLLGSKLPSITDGVHRNENFVAIIPVIQLFQTFSKKKKKL